MQKTISDFHFTIIVGKIIHDNDNIAILIENLENTMQSVKFIFNLIAFLFFGKILGV